MAVGTMHPAFIDGVNHYTSTAQLTKKWTSYYGSSIVTNAGISGTGDHVLKPMSYLYKTFGFGDGGGVAIEWIVGAHMKFTSSPPAYGDRLITLEDDEHPIAMLELTSTLGLYVAGYDANAIQSVPIPNQDNALHLNQWYYIEMRIKQTSYNDGELTVRIDGDVCLALTGLINIKLDPVFQPTFTKTIRFRGLYSALYIDDIYISFGSGFTDSSFLGPCRIPTIVPNDDTSTIEWTRSTGTKNYQCIDEIPPSTTDYVSTSTDGAKDLYKIDTSALPDSYDVKAVQITTMARKTASTPCFLQNQLVLGANTSEGENTALGENVDEYVIDVFQEKPGGGSWTQSDLESANLNIGIEMNLTA